MWNKFSPFLSALGSLCLSSHQIYVIMYQLVQLFLGPPCKSFPCYFYINCCSDICVSSPLFMQHECINYFKLGLRKTKTSVQKSEMLVPSFNKETYLRNNSNLHYQNCHCSYICDVRVVTTQSLAGLILQGNHSC